MKIVIATALALLLASPALATPQPVRPFDEGRMAGRWYELGRTPTSMNRGCQAGYVEWSAAGPERFRFAAVCHKGAVDGPEKRMSGQVQVIDRATHAKVKMTVLGGLVSREYWLIDHADDYGWLIMGTADGRYVAVMTARRQPTAAVREQALRRLAALGYDKSRMEFPPQA